MRNLKKNTHTLTEGSIWKGILLFALPLLGSSLIQQLYSTVDLIFVGQLLGTKASAAIGASGLIVTCLIGFFNGMAVGTNVFAARHYGAKRFNELKKLIQTIFWTGIMGKLLDIMTLGSTSFCIAIFEQSYTIGGAEDFVSCRKEIAEQIKTYETERQHIRNRIRRAKTPEEDYSLKEQCREITKKLTPLHKQLIICGRIENKVPRLRALIEQEKQLEQGRYKYKYYHQNKTKQRSYER